jgi:hypothetical protein
MANEKERMQIQKKIMEIDRQMGLEIENKTGRVPKLPRMVPFPTVLWITTALLFAAWMFGGQFLAPLAEYKMYIFYAACVGALIAVLKTVWFLVVRAKLATVRTHNVEESDKVQELRRVRDELQKRLQDLNG